jgi:hypothetical protein
MADQIWFDPVAPTHAPVAEAIREKLPTGDDVAKLSAIRVTSTIGVAAP